MTTCAARTELQGLRVPEIGLQPKSLHSSETTPCPPPLPSSLNPVSPNWLAQANHGCLVAVKTYLKGMSTLSLEGVIATGTPIPELAFI